MPPHELSPKTLDADNPRAADPQAPIPAPHADELAEAEARAEAARARAVRLRRLADAASIDRGDGPNAEDANNERDPRVMPAENTEDDPKEAPASRRSRPRRPFRLFRPPRLPRPSRRALAAALVICGALTASGYVAWQHHRVLEQHERAAQFATAARNAVVAMMSIDPDKARDDVQRFSESTTGMFKVGVLMSAENLIAAVEQSKATMKCTVQAVAVQSMTPETAVVLVTAKTEITKADQPKPQSRSWRLVVNVQREGTQLKIARFESVP
jgi:Mce-associated membrane protein